MSETMTAPTGLLRHPECPNEPDACRVTQSSKTVLPIIAWEPVFNGDGAQVNVDPNTFETDYKCETCSRNWMVRTTGGKTELVL